MDYLYRDESGSDIKLESTAKPISFGPESKCTCSYVKGAQIHTNQWQNCVRFLGSFARLRVSYLPCPSYRTFPCYLKIEDSILIKTLIQGPSEVLKDEDLSVLRHTLAESASNS
jgi:hypothetical protein